MASRAFTLIELAIVLVIIGLLVGGVLVGKDMIRNAELQSIIKQEESFRAAIHTFRNKYNGIPGDLKNATSFWGSAGGTGSDSACRIADSTGSVATCNGNGDGLMDTSTVSNVEIHRFWQQLSNAGLIAGAFSGTRASTNSAWSTSTANSPVSKRGGLWSGSNVNLSTSSEGFAIPYSNFLVLGEYYAGWGPGRPLLTPLDTWNVDVKADDGKPASGRIVVGVDTSAYSACTTATTKVQLDAEYLRTDDTGPQCKLVFLRQF